MLDSLNARETISVSGLEAFFSMGDKLGVMPGSRISNLAGSVQGKNQH